MNRFITGLGPAVVAMAAATLLGFAPAAHCGDKPVEGSADLLKELAGYRHKIVYETNRDGNWELYLCNADGSHPVNLTHTADVDELYPKPSPDGSKICFVADEGKGDAKIRNIYYMNSDGTSRVKIAANGREPCWNADGTVIAYLGGEFAKFSYFDAATKGLFLYDLETGKTREHVNHNLRHLYTLNCSPDGKWFVATVHGGMGFAQTILAVEADGNKIVDLRLSVNLPPQHQPRRQESLLGARRLLCGRRRPGSVELNPEGDQHSRRRRECLPDRDLSRDLVARHEVPDVHTRAQTQGLEPGRPLTGVSRRGAPGWNVCVADSTRKNRWVAITSDGKSCKQPSWVLVKEGAGK